MSTLTLTSSYAISPREQVSSLADTLIFQPITAQNMHLVWQYLQLESGRTCDFSYGGVLMWVDMFRYEMALAHDTLFIKGRLENDLRKVAFSLPIGSMPLRRSVEMLRQYCRRHRLELRFSALPEYCLDSFMSLNPRSISLLEDWGDYLYDIAPLATLKGKKMAKKRNHVNQYLNIFGPGTFEPLTGEILPDVLQYMSRLSLEAAPTPQAARERELATRLLQLMQTYDLPIHGGLLRIKGRVAAFTLGDIKGDTLHIHVEKADRSLPGAYEMINKAFAAYMWERFPSLQYINREDDGGDPGLRAAKQSYHPRTILKKYNVIF